MTLTETITGDIGTAMKARATTRLPALRMLKTALTNKSIEKGRELQEAEELQVVATLVKQRRDAIEQFTAGGREDLAAREAAEIEVLAAYLPPAASQADVDAAVARAVEATGATGPRDIGKVMKAALEALAGMSVDGKQVNEAVRARLGR